ncbi:MAG: hypothetical protein GY827_00315 [Cytophagales bacterium]|nr:hypothetical protein [Cytophagales bacterium]
MVDVYRLYERMQDNNIMLSFKGEVSFDLVKSVLDILEGRLEKIEDNPKVKKKVFNILVECLQNLGHHVETSGPAVDRDSHDNTALLMIWTEQGDYRVATGNYIKNENVEKLKAHIDKINSFESRQELRAFYQSILGNQQFSEKGGGGLGFIDIARKSGQKLDYNFKPVDEQYSFFSFQITIPKGA